MKNKNKSSIAIKVVGPLTLASAFLLLVACGESTNLNDPKQIVSTTKCSDLEEADDGVTCVSGRFIDDAVEGLDYSCGKVNAETGVDGSFACPVGTKVKFMLLNPDDQSESAKRITFGEVQVKKALADGVGDEWFYITPYDLGSGAINTVRLLQAISRDDPADLGLPSHRVIITDDDKRKLVVLPSSLGASDFAKPIATTPATPEAGTFDEAVKPFLDALTPAPNTMLTLPQAQAQLDQGLHSTVAGAYFVPGYAFTRGYIPTDDSFYKGDWSGMRGINPTQYLVGATWALVDRSGRISSFGVYSAGAASDDNACKFLIFASTSACPSKPVPNVMRLSPDAGEWSLWRSDGTWRVAYEMLDASGDPENGLLSVEQGRMDRGAMMSSSAFYRNVYGEEAPSGALGKWALSGGSLAFNASETSISMVKARPVAPTLDPDLWSALKPSFPLNFVMTFLSENPVGSGNYTNTVGKVRATILEDGNIVTNLNDHCGGATLNPKTLKVGALQEYPLGMVAQVFSSNSGGRTYVSPIMMIPNKATQFPAGLPNVQMGTSAAATSSSAQVTAQLRIRVDKNDMSKYLKVYDDSAFSDGNAIDVDVSAYWSNAVDFIRRSSNYDGRVTSINDPDCP